jgi:hypothetical protein
MMSRRTSYQRYKVVLFSALLAVPQYQVGHAFLPRLCSFYFGLLLQCKRSFRRAALSAGAGELLTNGDSYSITILE